MRPAPRCFLRAVLIAGACIISILAPRAIAAGAKVQIQIDPTHPGNSVAPGFTGLSFEAALLLPEHGTHYFRSDNQPLIRLFHTLDIRNLRIGGNTSDRDARQLPNQADIDSLFAFARAANVKVIYCLRLHNGDTNIDIQTAKYIMDHYAALVDSFSIGQEPSAYPAQKVDTDTNAAPSGTANEKYSYNAYREDWKRFADALLAAVPGIRFCGPSVHKNGEWARRFIQDFGRSNHVALITEHLYPGGAGEKVPTPETGRDRMLANDAFTDGFSGTYQKLYDSFVPSCRSAGLPYRLEEVNNFYNGGAKNVSDTFASALWSLDFMYWWAAHRATGLNFHTGDRVAAGHTLLPSKYTAFFSTTNGFAIRPLGYGIKAFDLGSHGKFVRATIAGLADLNLSAYAVLGNDKNLYVTLINKEHGPGARSANISLSAGANFTQGEIISLTQSFGDVAAVSGVTLGGAAIRSDGGWDGDWKPISTVHDRMFSLAVPAASAMIVRLMPPEPNYDESKVGTYTLPDPLRLDNGQRVSDSRTWMKKRRPEILELYHEDIYGHAPARVPRMKFDVWDTDRHALGGIAVRKQIDISFPGHAHPVLHVLLYTPADATGPVPTFLCLSFTGNEAITTDTAVRINQVWDSRKDIAYTPTGETRGASHSWKIPETLARGYGVAAIYYGDIEPDLSDGSGWRFGVRSLFLKPGRTNNAPDSWGAIGAWAWGASRVLDYLQTDQDVDARHVIMLGHSRLGKTALWAAAQDPRFCMVIANCSGEMGAALARRNYGETVTSMAKSFPYQFCRNFLNYSNHISEMPVDSHMLLSLIAPRPLYLSTGSEDRWGDPRGEFLAAQAASPVYELFGLHGLTGCDFPSLDKALMRDIGFSCHTGKHDVLPADWDRFLDFADRHLKGRGSREN